MTPRAPRLTRGTHARHLAGWALLLALACSTSKTADSQKSDTQKAEAQAADSTASAESGTADPPGASHPCTSGADCATGQYCTVEDGVCAKPPGCGPNDMCPMVCYGICAIRKTSTATGPKCGPKTCAAGQICCNPSCGICTPPDGMCTQQECSAGDAGAAPTVCQVDADCRLFSDYCTGCDCRALRKDAPDPRCKGPGVRCTADPCGHKRAICQAGTCVVKAAAP